MSFNVQQQKVINHYREMYNIASIISDDVVVDMIIRDMIHSGKVYAGFESLVQGAAVNRQNNDNKTEVFGFGFNNDGSMELAFKNNSSEYLTLLPTRKESQALSFMQRILKESENTLAEREKDAGPVSAFTNFVRTISFNKYSKRSVKKEIEKFEKQLEEIERAAKGEKVHKDFLGNVSTITFKDEFKRVRGVEFNADKITATIEKSSEIANIRTCYQSVQAVKELLGYSSSGIYNITHPQEATAAILQAFEVLGVTKGEDKANLLKQIFEQYKDHPVMKEYNCKSLTFDKNQNGEYCIYRWLDYEGNSTEAPIEVIRLIVKELANRLDKTLATGLNIEFDENTSSEELSKLCNESISKHEEEYQKMFAESFGGKNVKELSDEYVLKQQQDVATFEMVENMICMGLMLAPGGVTATSGWLLKTGKFAQTAQKMAKAGAALTKVQKFASPIIMGSMILSPTQLIEQGFSENGLSDEELEEWKNRVVQNSIYMAAGMASSSIAAKCAAQYKTARLVHTLKASGKSFDEIQAMIKANPAQFSDDIVAEFSKISKQGMYGQIGGEIALDVSSTVALNLIMGNGTLTSTEVINSIIFAFSGGALQKQFAPLTTETKIAFLMDNFKDYGITYSDAEHILKTLDDITAGNWVSINTQKYEAGIRQKIDELKQKYPTVHETEYRLEDGTLATFEIYTGSQEGGNTGFYAVNKNSGVLYYIKYAKNPKAEALAADLYQLAGIDVPEISTVLLESGHIAILSKYIPNLEVVNSANRQVNQGFGMDALIANWDAVQSNNTMTDGTSAIRIDVGCCFDYRAHGQNKVYNRIVSELYSLLDPKYRMSAEIFSTMTREDCIASLKNVASINLVEARKLFVAHNQENYFNIFKARIEFIDKVYKEMEKNPQGNLTMFEYMKKTVGKIARELSLENYDNHILNIHELENKKQQLFDKLLNAKTKEDFEIICKTINEMPYSTAKLELIEQFRSKYNEWMQNPEGIIANYPLEDYTVSSIKDLQISSKNRSQLRYKGIITIEEEKTVTTIEKVSNGYRVIKKTKDIAPMQITPEKRIDWDKTLKMYVMSPLFEDINKAMEAMVKNESISEDMKFLINNLEELIESQPPSKAESNQIVYRTEKTDWIIRQLPETIREQLEILPAGEVINLDLTVQQPHFISTSKLSNGGYAITSTNEQARVMYKLQVEEGCKMLDVIDYLGIDYFGGNQGLAEKVMKDREILFQNGTIIKINSIKKNNEGIFIINGALLPVIKL